MKEEWLFPNTIVPVDVETTSELIAEIKRLIGVIGAMALAQPEQEPVGALVDVRRTDSGWYANGPWYNIYNSVARADDTKRRTDGAGIEVRVVPLYTSPPQRTWAGLTDDEIDKTLKVYEQNYGWISFAKAISAKLKEKNTFGNKK